MPPAPRPSSSPFPCLPSPLPVCPRSPRLPVSCRPSDPTLSIRSLSRLHPLPGLPARRIPRSSLACSPCTLSPGKRPPREAAVPPGWLPNGFAAMQHELAYRLQPAVDQAVFVRCTIILGTVFTTIQVVPFVTQEVRYNPFNFFPFHPDFGWTSATTGP